MICQSLCPAEGHMIYTKWQQRAHSITLDFTLSKRLCFLIGCILEPGYDTRSRFLPQLFQIFFFQFHLSDV